MSSIDVLVLAGGPDLERDVSIASGRGIAEALAGASGIEPRLEIIDTPSVEALASLPGDVIFPAMHGSFSEGGPLQDILVADGRPFVGSGPNASRLAIDKVLSKRIATEIGFHATPSAVFNPADPRPVLSYPLVVKPVFEGSTIGLHVCANDAHWLGAHEKTRAAGLPAMIEPYVRGRELTVPLVDLGSGLQIMPLIEIIPSDGLYDYEAKYQRDDTRYIVAPELPIGVGERMGALTLELAARMGIRHLCRADFIIDASGTAWFLEINTMPGFTSHSLVPMACAHAGVSLTDLCAAIVRRALDDHPQELTHATQAHHQG